MGSDWERVSLTDLYDVSSGLSKPASEFGSGFPFLAFTDVFNNYFVPKKLSGLVQSSLKEQEKCSVQRGDVFLTRTSETMHELGMSSVALIDYEHATFNGFTKRLRPKKGIKILPEYVGYYLRSQIFRNEMLSFSTMSTRASLNNSMIGQLTIPVPPKNTQQFIAWILKKLDDKIELNRQMNETLESMAQALFKSWFVDFDPVIDNALAAGNPIPDVFAERAEQRRELNASVEKSPESGGVSITGSEKNHKSLFPNEFEFNAEKGWIPKGWENRPISNSFKLLGGHSFKSSDYIDDGDYGVVTIRNVQDGSFVQTCTNKITEVPPKMKEHCYLKAGDVLLSLTGNVGRTCFLSKGSYLLNQRVSKIVGIDGIPNSYAYYFFRQKPLYEEMLTIAKGTAQQNLSPIETIKIKHISPPNQTVMQLSLEFDIYFKKAISNINQSQSLASLRDRLLPKLLSGELRIPDAEKLIEEAGV